MPLGLMTIRSVRPASPGTRADTLPEVQATSPWVTRAAFSRYTSVRARSTASRMLSVTLPPSRDVVPEGRRPAVCGVRPGACGVTAQPGRSAAGSRPGSFRGTPAGQHPVAQRAQLVQHLVGAAAEVVVQRDVLRV